MSGFLYHYHPVEPSTWFYLSSLLMIGLFFKFSRFWSVRNLDLVLLILLAPGLLFIHYGRQMDREAARLQSSSVASDTTNSAGDSGHDRSPNAVDSAPESGTSLRAGIENEQLAGRREVLVPVEPLDRATDVDVAGMEEAGADDESGVTGDLAAGAADADANSGDLTELSNGQRTQKYGYLWLFCAGVIVMARLLADPTMVRRPLLEPNLSAGGLTFIGCSLFVFLMANVISKPSDDGTATAVAVQDGLVDQHVVDEGPGYSLLASLPSAVKKAFAILAHLIVVVGMVLIGYWHFDNIIMGVGAATLYLMLPYTALMTNEIKHIMPAASLVWAVLCYRRPLTAGMFLGLAGGMTYYPLFLLPLWLSFYWPRGLWRFVTGVVIVLMLLVFVLFSSTGVVQNVRLMFGLYSPAMENLRGIWDGSLNGWSTYYRIPVLVAFVAVASSLTLWPAQKNLGTLLSCSAAVMVATQFWHGYGGGVYMAWYLPLLLLTIFRPNLEDRVALTVLAEGWLPRRMSVLPTGKAAFSISRVS